MKYFDVLHQDITSGYLWVVALWVIFMLFYLLI